jgi:hypothetical protein
MECVTAPICDRYRRPQSIDEMLAQLGSDGFAVRPFLDGLLADRPMLTVDGRYLRRLSRAA